MEQTFIMISLVSPNSSYTGLVVETISRFQKMRFSCKGSKIITVDGRFAKKPYADLFATLVFNGLADYIASGLVFAMVWEGENVVLTGQKIIGATNPSESAPGTIRSDFDLQKGRNFIHGSDSIESATKEIALWFSNDDNVGWERGLRYFIPE